MKPKVYIMEEQELYIKLYEISLSSDYEIEILPFSLSNQSIETVITKDNPGVVMISPKAFYPELVEAIKQIRLKNSHTGIVLFVSLKSHVDLDYLRKIASIKSGGLGLFQKQSIESAGQLISIIDTVYKGQIIMDSFLSSKLFSIHDECPVLSQMTQREKEILALVADGYTNESIAKKLFIDVKTVEHHINNMYSKLKSISNFEEKHPRVHATRLYLEATNILIEPASSGVVLARVK